MQARVETNVAGGRVEIVYTSDPTTLDGLTQEELTETIVGLIPGVISAATYPDFDKVGAARILRSLAEIWDPETDYVYARSLCGAPYEGYTYWENEH